jgi:hypothetical protein
VRYSARLFPQRSSGLVRFTADWCGLLRIGAVYCGSGWWLPHQTGVGKAGDSGLLRITPDGQGSQAEAGPGSFNHERHEPHERERMRNQIPKPKSQIPKKSQTEKIPNPNGELGGGSSVAKAMRGRGVGVYLTPGTRPPVRRRILPSDREGRTRPIPVREASGTRPLGGRWSG